MAAPIFCRRLAESGIIVMPSVMIMNWSAIQVKNWQETICIEEKLDIIRQHEKGERIFDICCNVRLSSVCTIHVNADRIKALSQELKCWCSRTTTVLSEWTVPKTVAVSLIYIFIALEINILYRKCMYIVYILYIFIYSIYITYILLQVHMSINGTLYRMRWSIS